MANPAPAILTTIASLWDRLSRWIGRTEAEQAESQQSKIDAMDAKIQGEEKVK